MAVVEFIFIMSVLAIFYAYIGYPISLILFVLFKKREVKKSEYYPDVTFIVTACNEELRIKEKLENTIKLDYPQEHLAIIVASDGSTDRTNEIVKSYEDHGVELLLIKERVGKENAQKIAIEKSKGEILVFSDVATRIESRGVKEIAFNFADPSVGCVSSEDRLITKDGQPSGEGFYVKYEMWLRSMESKANSLVGLSGSFFAARRNVFYDFSGQMQSDFRTLLNSVKIGLRGISDPKAIGYYMDVGDNSREFERKIRTVVRGLTVFFKHLEFLNFLQYGIFSYQYFCHKFLRWSVPLFLAIAFILNLILIFTSPIFALLFFVQCLFYLLAGIGLFSDKPSYNLLVKIPMYFTNVNASIAVAWFRFLKGERVVMWQPSKR